MASTPWNAQEDDERWQMERQGWRPDWGHGWPLLGSTCWTKRNIRTNCWWTRDDGRLENHQCLGICEGPHGTVSEKLSLDWVGSTLSHLQGDMGKEEKQPLRYAFCQLFDPLKIHFSSAWENIWDYLSGCSDSGSHPWFLKLRNTLEIYPDFFSWALKSYGHVQEKQDEVAN